VIDFHGFSILRDSNPKAGMLTARRLAHYPEQMGRVLAIDMPHALWGMCKLCQRCLNARTQSKIAFVSSTNGTLQADIESWTTASLQSWLLAEVRDNRRLEIQGGRKQYWLEPTVTCVQKPQHDPRGDIDFISSPEYKFSLTCRAREFQLSHPDVHKHFPGKQPHDVLEDGGSIKLLSLWWCKLVNLAVMVAAIAVAASRVEVLPAVGAAVVVVAVGVVLVGACGIAFLRQPLQQRKASYSLHRPQPTPLPQLAPVEQDEPKPMLHVPRRAEVLKQRECGCGCWE